MKRVLMVVLTGALLTGCASTQVAEIQKPDYSAHKFVIGVENSCNTELTKADVYTKESTGEYCKCLAVATEDVAEKHVGKSTLDEYQTGVEAGKGNHMAAFLHMMNNVVPPRMSKGYSEICGQDCEAQGIEAVAPIA